MERRLQRAVMTVLLTLPGTCSPYQYAQQLWSSTHSARFKSDGHARESAWSFPIRHAWIPVVAKRTSATQVSPNVDAWHPEALSARGSSDGLIRENIWSFPYKYEWIPVVAKRMLETRTSNPCNTDDVAKQSRQARLDDCEVASVTPTTTAHVASHRPLGLGGRWPRPFSNDTRLDFLGVLAVVVVKLIMSTALASWFLVGGQLLFAIADITGSSEVFGNRSPVTFIFQALPLVEILLRGSSTFDK